MLKMLGQLRLRADRLGIEKKSMERIEILCSGNLEEIETALNGVHFFSGAHRT
jgi:predicted ATP-dependent serine protease